MNSDSSFPNYKHFIYFTCLIALVRAFNTMLNNSSESGHPCRFPNFRGRTFDFLSLSLMLAMILSYMVFIMLRYAHFIINVC